MDDLLRVGIITSPHGIQGEVNVYPTTDEPEMFKKWKTLVLDRKGEQKELKLESAKFFKQMIIIKLEGFNDRNAAELLRSGELWIHRSQASPLKPGQHFIVDLIGLTVVSDEGETIGTLTDVLKTGANDVYEVTDAAGHQILFPVIPQCILDVNLENQTMTVHVLDGLMDIYR